MDQLIAPRPAAQFNDAFGDKAKPIIMDLAAKATETWKALNPKHGIVHIAVVVVAVEENDMANFIHYNTFGNNPGAYAAIRASINPGNLEEAAPIAGKPKIILDKP